MRSQLAALIDQNADALTNTANLLVSIFSSIDAIKRVGFYIRWGRELTPGTFRGLRRAQGYPSVQAVSTLPTQRIADMHAFPRHLACDARSRYAIAVPLFVAGEFAGVPDMNSSRFDRFDAEDQAGIESLCTVFCRSILGRDGFI